MWISDKTGLNRFETGSDRNRSCNRKKPMWTGPHRFSPVFSRIQKRKNWLRLRSMALGVKRPDQTRLPNTRNTVSFKMHSDGHIGFVVGGCPGVHSKVQHAFVVLKTVEVSQTEFSIWQHDSFTCSIFAICLRTRTNTFFTSQEMVAGEGSGYSGRPVFMRLRNPWSLTILNGCLLSATQRTISALNHSFRERIIE